MPRNTLEQKCFACTAQEIEMGCPPLSGSWGSAPVLVCTGARSPARQDHCRLSCAAGTVKKVFKGPTKWMPPRSAWSEMKPVKRFFLIPGKLQNGVQVTSWKLQHIEILDRIWQNTIYWIYCICMCMCVSAICTLELLGYRSFQWAPVVLYGFVVASPKVSFEVPFFPPRRRTDWAPRPPHRWPKQRPRSPRGDPTRSPSCRWQAPPVGHPANPHPWLQLEPKHAEIDGK